MARPAKPPQAPAKKSKLAQGIWITVVIVAVLCVAAYCSSQDSGGVEPVDGADAQSVVADLSRASAAHGICYGWQLLDSATPVSSGSNLGVGVKVADRPDQCPKYVEVRGMYHYYPDSSESTDYATYSIFSNLSGSGKLDPNAFDRLGAGTGRLLDDPTTTILDAAQALPLLTQEAGLATAPVPEPSVTGSPAPLESGGSDFWRDRWVLLLVTGVLLLGAIFTLILGIRSSRRIKRGEESDPFAKTPPPAPGPVPKP
jgi:flagellar basal body-associated protein FliL